MDSNVQDFRANNAPDFQYLLASSPSRKIGKLAATLTKHVIVHIDQFINLCVLFSDWFSDHEGNAIRIKSRPFKQR